MHFSTLNHLRRLEFDEYQEEATATDQFPPGGGPEQVMIPLLGLSGEVGSLLSEFKKRIRDGESYESFPERVENELGDILWYLCNLASRLDISMSRVASRNLNKNQERWPIQEAPRTSSAPTFFDADFPRSEKLPRKLTIEITESEPGRAQMFLLPKRKPLGDTLTNNAPDDDGYRYHDVFHLAHMAVLGWSPVIRSLLGRKRKSTPDIDEIEDGGRAIVLEEALVAYVYNHAKERRFFKGMHHVETELLMLLRQLVSHLEVNARSAREWEEAILQGYSAFRYVLENGRATLVADMGDRRLTVLNE